MPCKFPEHHKSGNGGSVLPVLVAALVLAAFLSGERHAIAHAAGVVFHALVLIALAVTAAAVLAAASWVTVRLARGHRFRLPKPWKRCRHLPAAARSVFRLRRLRYLPAAVWARLRWRWLVRNLGAAYPDRHRKGRVRSPRALIWPSEHGIAARIRTVPGTGRGDFEKHAEHIANSWKCARVQVSQRKPGQLVIRGLRTDPLTLPYPMSAAPAGVYGSDSVQNPLRLYIGRDEFGADRWLPLAGITGITVGGLPGFGKTSLINSWLMQLAGLEAVQFVIIDGKGGGDYADWEDRAFIATGDELPAAAAALEDTHSLMRTRLGSVLELSGHKNAWHAGPTAAFPLVVTIVDECHTFFDLDAVKGDREAEPHIRACRGLTGQLVKKGRSVLFLTILITQKQTSDAVPTAIRDNCRFGTSFAVKTRDAAVAALGEQIREYPSYCPTTLQDPAYIGVSTASLRTGQDPFVRIRCPEVSEAAAAARAAETASKRSDPRLTPELILEPV